MEVLICNESVASLCVSVPRRLTPIIPGIYGYGRAPYVAPLQTDKGQKTGRIRRRRSAASEALHLTPRLQGGHRSNSFDLSNQFHPYSMQLKTPPPQNNQVWAPLYQPELRSHGQVQQKAPSGSEVYGQQHQQRPDSPLPTSFCAGEHAHFRICSNHVGRCVVSVSRVTKHDYDYSSAWVLILAHLHRCLFT